MLKDWLADLGPPVAFLLLLLAVGALPSFPHWVVQGFLFTFEIAIAVLTPAIWRRIKCFRSRTAVQWSVFGLVAVWVMIFTHAALLIDWFVWPEWMMRTSG